MCFEPFCSAVFCVKVYTFLYILRKYLLLDFCSKWFYTGSMKKIFLVLFVLFSFVIFSCVSTSSYTQEGNFRHYYNDVTGVSELIHEDLNTDIVYDLRDNIFGEREHFSVEIKNGSLILVCYYQYKKSANFSDAVVIADNERLQIHLDSRSVQIGSNFVREYYVSVLSPETAADIRRMMQSEKCAVAFLGDYTTDKMAVSAEIREAVIETIDYYLERL